MLTTDPHHHNFALTDSAGLIKIKRRNIAARAGRKLPESVAKAA